MFSFGLFAGASEAKESPMASIDLKEDSKKVNKLVADLEAAFDRIMLEVNERWYKPSKPEIFEEEKSSTLIKQATEALHATKTLDDSVKSTIKAIYAWRNDIEMFHSCNSLKSTRATVCRFALKQAYQLQHWLKILEAEITKTVSTDDVLKIISARNLSSKPPLNWGIYLSQTEGSESDFLNDAFNRLQYSLDHYFNGSIAEFRAHAIAISTPNYNETLATAVQTTKQFFDDIGTSVSNYFRL